MKLQAKYGTIDVYSSIGKFSMPPEDFEEFDEDQQVYHGEMGKPFKIWFVVDELCRQFSWIEAQAYFMNYGHDPFENAGNPCICKKCVKKWGVRKPSEQFFKDELESLNHTEKEVSQ
jgi:hypothetical protein